ncbi:MAG: Chromosome partition protein smc, partial [uncultured Chloroflexia bacterium]
NGSGKSNLIDALRWAAGGGRAGEFRAGDKRELIFHGSSGKRSLGFAEVEVGLEHGGRTLTVSRTLTRDGDSRLKVGGRTARFLDLEDELSGTGLGRGGLAVIGQGEVSGVLMADPPKLLAYVAESVGVAKLTARREGTLAGLEAARLHLTRLEDVRGGLQERVGVLTLEAEGAERAAALSRERLQLRFTLSLRRVEGLTVELAGLREKGARLEAQLLEGREALTQAQNDRRAVKVRLAGAEARYREFMAASEARRGDVRVARERLRAAEMQCAALRRDRERVVGEVRTLEMLTAPTPFTGSKAAHEAVLTAAEVRSRDLQHLLSNSLEEVTARARALEAARRAEATAAQARARYTMSREALLAQLSDVAAQEGTLLETDPADLADAAASAEAAAREHGAQLEAAQDALAQLQQEHAAAVAEAQAQTQAAGRLRAAFEARRGYAQGPKSALTSGLAGIIGSVADLITVPPEYAQAISSALGRRAEHVVVDSATVAQRVLAHVRRAGGWVTLLPLDLVGGRPQELPPALAAEAGVVAWASEVVGSDGRFRPLVQRLLGGTALVTTLPEAVALAKRHRTRPRFVTLEGDVLEAYGAISGGRSQTVGLVLGAAADLGSAEETAGVARTRAASLTEALMRQQSVVKTLREAHRSAQARHQDAARAWAAAREEAAAGASLKAELARRHAQLKAALEGLTPPVETAVPDSAPLETTLLEAQRRQEALRAEFSDAQGREAAARGALALWCERKMAFDAAQRRSAGLREQLGSLAREVDGAEAALRAATDALKAAEAALPPDDGAEAARYRAAQEAETEAEARLEALSRQQATLAGELEAVNLTRARREAVLEAAETEHRTLPEGVAALSGGLKSLRDRLAEVEADLEQLGPVNHRAAQEVAAQQERLDDLSRQMADAEGAVNELHAVLGDLDDAVRVRLVAGTEALAEGFARYAEHLFGVGARASAELVWEDGRPVGLKLGLQPPTKQTRALSLLSVGERTMGALAFLFALMTVVPASAVSAAGASALEAPRETSGLPLAILDEVDAPLDEANIRRFCAFLDELSRRGTQFVLITHQKATMEVASALWGVTTEGGVSRVFSIRREVEA